MLINKILSECKKENGSILILVTVGMTAFLLLLGLVTDVGFLYFQRAHLVNGVDASALAGVQELPVQPTNAYTVAYDYGNYNKIDFEEMSVEILQQNTQIVVNAARDVELFFLKLLGFNSVEIQAAAKAEVGSVTAMRGVAPFGVQEDDFQDNETYYLKYDAHSGNFSGNFGALALGGPGASTYQQNIEYGYQGVIRIGDLLSTEPGNMAGPTRKGIESRLNMQSYCDLSNVSQKCPRVVIVPIIDSLDVPGRDEVEVVGFAAFHIEEMVGTQGQQAEVKGRFIPLAVDGDIGDGTDFGLVAYRLIE